MAVKVLDSAGWQARLRRMAYEIYERHFDRKTYFLWGINERGYALARMLNEYLLQISPKEIYAFPFRSYGNEAAVSIEQLPDFDPEEAVFIVIDDVLYTGRTLFAAVHALYPYAPSKLEVAVLIDRGHHYVPIQAQYVGMELATTLQEYITVEIEGDRIEAFLE